MMMRLPPRPVRVPPTEVESRFPPSVVANSSSVSLAGLIRVFGKQAIVHRRAHDRAAVVGMFARETFSIADTDDPPCRVMAEDEGRECDRGADRLEAARRHRDDQALDLALTHARQSERDGLDMPVRGERHTRRNDRKDRLYERVEVVPQDRGGDTRIGRHDFAFVLGGIISIGAGCSLPLFAVVCGGSGI